MLTISTYIKTHEKLLIFILAFGLIYFISGRIENAIAAHDKANLTAQQSVLQAQADKNAQLAVQVQQQSALYQSLAEKVQAQNAALEQANVTLATALAKQQKTDNAMTPTELTVRWNQLVPAANPTVTPTGVTLTSVGAAATVTQLELVPVQQEELTSAQTEIKGDESVISAANASISTLNLRISGLTAQIADETKECTAQIAVVKAANHKANRRWFVAGFIAGIATRILGKF